MTKIEAIKTIKAYAQWLADECGDETSLTASALEESDNAVVIEIGRAMLERNEAISDIDYRYGGKLYDERLSVIAKHIGWSA